MSIITQDLLESNQQQVIFSPSVLVEMRQQQQVSYARYFELLTGDLAQNLTPAQWGQRLAEEGKVSVARECWRRAGLPLDTVHERYQLAITHWEKQIASMVVAISETRTKLGKKGLKSEDEQLYDAMRAESELYAEKHWYDLARETLAVLQKHLDERLEEVERERSQERTQLLAERDELLALLQAPDYVSASGEAGLTAARRLLEHLEVLLEVGLWNAKLAHQRVEEARRLYKGAAYKPETVAKLLGERLPAKDVGPEEEDGLARLIRSLPNATLEVPSAPEIAAAGAPVSEPAEASPAAPTIAESSKPASRPAETSIRLSEAGGDKDAERRSESIALHMQADKERADIKNFKRAEELYIEALRQWRGNEAAAKNYATMLRYLKRIPEAIAVLERSLQYAQERLPIYNLLTNYCTDSGQYEKARDYSNRALRLVGDARSEIGVLTGIYTLEIKAQDYRKALQAAEAILRLNPDHEQMRKNKTRLEELQTGESQPITENLYETPETVAELNIEISPLIREDLEDCELTKVSPRILNNLKVSTVLSECDRLQDETKKLHSQQYRERADYFLQSAKLISQLLGHLKQAATNEERLEEAPSENVLRKLERELSDALGTYTGVMGDRYYAQGNMDSARDYYLEHVRVRTFLPVLSRRRIAKYFQSFIPERADLQIRVPDNDQRQPYYVLLEIMQHTLQEAEGGIFADVSRGVLELACTSHLVVDIITRAIRSDSIYQRLFQRVIDQLLRQQGMHQALLSNLGNERPEDVFTHLVYNRQASIRQQEQRLTALIGSVGDHYRLIDADQEMNYFTNLQNEWSQTDRSFFLSLRELLRESTQYFNQEGQFSDREHLAHSILNRADNLRRRLDNEPTSLGKTYITRIVYQLKRLIEKAFQELQQSSLPILRVRVVQTRWISDNKVRECHIEVVNEGESPANEVSLHILPSETGDYLEDHKAYLVGSVFRPHAASVAIPITLPQGSSQSEIKDAIDLHMRLDYYDRERTRKETPPTRLRLSLQDEVQFTRIANPYQPGQPIMDKRMFMGRQEMIEELAAEMTSAGRTSAVVIYGQKRSGKTSILRNLEEHLRTQPHPFFEHVIAVTFSMQSVLTRDEWMTRSLFYLIAQEIYLKCLEAGLGDQIGELTWNEINAVPNPEIPFRMYLNKIRRLPSTRLVLLIDEFTELSGRIDEGYIDRNIMKYLKSLIELGLFSCVICGIDTMPQVLSRYANELAVSDPRTVGYLSHDAARQLIEEPILLPNGQSRYTSPQVVEELIRLTAGSPYYIQFICHRLVEYMNRETRSPTITGADLDRVVRVLISSLDPYTKFDNLTRYKGDITLDTYETTLEGLFLYLLADEARLRPLVAFSAIRQRAPFVNEAELLDIAEELETRQVIERSEGTTRQYRIVVGLFQRWINTKRQMDEDMLSRFRLQLEEARQRDEIRQREEVLQREEVRQREAARQREDAHLREEARLRENERQREGA